MHNGGDIAASLRFKRLSQICLRVLTQPTQVQARTLPCGISGRRAPRDHNWLDLRSRPTIQAATMKTIAATRAPNATR